MLGCGKILEENLISEIFLCSLLEKNNLLECFIHTSTFYRIITVFTIAMKLLCKYHKQLNYGHIIWYFFCPNLSLLLATFGWIDHFLFLDTLPSWLLSRSISWFPLNCMDCLFRLYMHVLYFYIFQSLIHSSYLITLISINSHIWSHNFN